jgi:hypothetical protein
MSGNQGNRNNRSNRSNQNNRVDRVKNRKTINGLIEIAREYIDQQGGDQPSFDDISFIDVRNPDGDTPEITQWNVPNVTKPTFSQLSDIATGSSNPNRILRKWRSRIEFDLIPQEYNLIYLDLTMKVYGMTKKQAVSHIYSILENEDVSQEAKDASSANNAGNLLRNRNRGNGN